MKIYSFTKKLQITNYKLILAIITALALSIFFGMTARAQDGFPTDDDVNKIAKQLYCPVCESTPLDVCPTEACRQWREVIRTMLADGNEIARPAARHSINIFQPCPAMAAPPIIQSTGIKTFLPWIGPF